MYHKKTFNIGEYLAKQWKVIAYSPKGLVEIGVTFLANHYSIDLSRYRKTSSLHLNFHCLTQGCSLQMGFDKVYRRVVQGAKPKYILIKREMLDIMVPNNWYETWVGSSRPEKRKEVEHQEEEGDSIMPKREFVGSWRPC